MSGRPNHLLPGFERRTRDTSAGSIRLIVLQSLTGRLFQDPMPLPVLSKAPTRLWDQTGEGATLAKQVKRFSTFDSIGMSNK